MTASKHPLLTSLERGTITHSAEEMEALGMQLAQCIPHDTIISLQGDLGSGKTTFIRGLAKGLGIKDVITSPSFTLYCLYQGPEFQLVHIDAYRIHNQAEFDALMIEEFLKPPYCIALEWPEKIGNAFLHQVWKLSFHINQPGQHRITLALPQGTQ